MSKLQKLAEPQSTSPSTSSGASTASTGPTTSNSEVAAAVPAASSEGGPQGALAAALKAEEVSPEEEDEPGVDGDFTGVTALGEMAWDVASDPAGTAEGIGDAVTGAGESVYDAGASVYGAGESVVEWTPGAAEDTAEYIGESASSLWDEGTMEDPTGMLGELDIGASGEEMWDETSEWTSGAAEDSWEWMQGAASDTGEWMGDEALPWMGEAATDVGEFAYANSIGTLVDAGEGVVGQVVGGYESAVSVGEWTAGAAVDTAEYMGDTASSLWDEGTFDDPTGIFGEVDLGVSGEDVLEGASDTVKEAAGWIGDTAQELVDVDAMADTASDVVDEVVEQAEAAWEFSSGLATETFEGAQALGEEAWREADEMLHLSELASSAADLATQIIDELPSVEDVTGTISDTASDAWDASYEVMGNAVEDSTEWIGGLATDVSGPVQDLVLGGVDFIEQSLPDFEEVFDEFQDLGAEAWGSVTGWSGDAWDQAGDWAEDFGEWSLDFGESAFEGMADLWDETAGIRELADGVIGDVTEGIGTATRTVESAISAALEALADAVASFFSGW